jgi:hypothetical protein
MPGTLVPDTTSQTITGKSGTADFTIDDGVEIHSYKCILDAFDVTELTEMTRADTFCNEGSADQEPGRSQLVGSASGLGKFDGPSSGPLIPAPQGVALLLTYHTGCTIALDANFTEASAIRIAGQNMRISARFLSKGAYVVTWDRTPPP